MFALSEAYPNLKASGNFRQLQSDLSDVENGLAAARRMFNDIVRQNNIMVQQFPAGQPAKGDTARLAIVHSAAGAAGAWDVMLCSKVAEGQFAATSTTTKQACQQGVAVLGRAVMAAGGNVVADHLADRFGLLPVDIAFMGVRLQRQPVAACLAANPRLDTRLVIARRDGRITMGIGAA